MFEQELSQLQRQQLIRHLIVVDSSDGSHVTMNGKSILLMCTNDYLGLSHHPALRLAAQQSMESHGFGSGASRLVSGTSALHQELEKRIAIFKGTESALLFNSGYAANTGIIPAIAATGDVVLSDSLNHASIIDGCRLSKADVLVYRHKDLDHLEQLLHASLHARRKLIVTDGVFSMDGDIAPLPDIVFLAEKYNALVMVDDAHATGVLGRTGRGSVEHFGLFGRVHIQMGTFGKALGSFGAYAAGSKDLIDFLVNCARSFIYSTALPPSICAASLAAIEVLEQEPERIEALWKNRERLVKGLNELGITIGDSETPIVPVHIGDSGQALKLAEKLFASGVYAIAIRPPTVPFGSARIRTTVTAAHSAEDIDSALDVFKRLHQEGYC